MINYISKRFDAKTRLLAEFYHSGAANVKFILYSCFLTFRE